MCNFCKKIISLALLVSFSHSFVVAIPNNTPVFTHQNKYPSRESSDNSLKLLTEALNEDYTGDIRYVKAERLRRIGVGLTSAGIVGLILGFGVGFSGLALVNRAPPEIADNEETITLALTTAGFTTLAVSAGFIMAGTPLWVWGHKRGNEIKKIYE